MSSAISRVIARSIRGRLYGTQAVASQSESQVATKTKLSNGLTVASVENNSPVSKVAVIVNAGPRHEKNDETGVTHALRRGAALAAGSFTSLGITKNIQLDGGNLSCTSTRELMLYCYTGRRNVGLSTPGSILRDIVTDPMLYPWELRTIHDEMALDLALMESNPNAKLIELLHNAAYRGTLGRSLYAPEHKLGSFNREQLHTFFKNNYTSERMALIGVGVDHNELEELGNQFNISSLGAAPEKATFAGGEVREGMAGDMSYVAVVNEGVGYSSRDLMTAMVLQIIMGTTPSIKYADNTNVSRLGQAVSQVTSSPFAVSCINMNYSDSGLFGFHVQGNPNDIDKMVKTAANQFASITKGGVTDQEVARAKNKVKTACAMCLENGDSLIADMAEQVFSQEQFYDLAEIDRAVDAIKTTDVVNLAKRIVNGTPAMAATGNSQNVPHLPELFK